MKTMRARVASVLFLVTAVTGGVLLTGTSQAGASPVDFECTGVTNDVGVKWWQLSYGYVFQNGQFVKNYKNYSTGAFMSLLGQTLNAVGAAFPVKPVLSGDVVIDAPASAPTGGVVNPSLNALMTLPDNLITDARNYLGLDTILLRNSTIALNATQTNPAFLQAPIPNQTVPLVSGTSLTAAVSGPMTVTGTTDFVAYSPGVAHVELLVDPVAFPNGKFITQINFNGTIIGGDGPLDFEFFVYGLRFNCNPLSGAIAFTQITGGATTTTAATTTTSASTTTEAPTTTTTSTSTTTTTTTSTTSTTEAPTTTTTTQAPTTTTTTQAPTTTTTLPPGSADVVSVAVNGYGYTNSGPLTSGNFVVAPNTSLGGRGTLAGKNGGSASVAADVKQFLFWSFGTVSVSDPGAGLPPLTGYVFFGPSVSRTASGGGFVFANNQFRTHTISLSVTESAPI